MCIARVVRERQHHLGSDAGRAEAAYVSGGGCHVLHESGLSDAEHARKDQRSGAVPATAEECLGEALTPTDSPPWGRLREKPGPTVPFFHSADPWVKGEPRTADATDGKGDGRKTGELDWH